MESQIINKTSLFFTFAVKKQHYTENGRATRSLPKTWVKPCAPEGLTVFVLLVEPVVLKSSNKSE